MCRSGSACGPIIAAHALSRRLIGTRFFGPNGFVTRVE